MERDILEALIVKTKNDSVKWGIEDGYRKASSFSFVCRLSDGMFLLDFVPKYPLKDSQYFLSWFPFPKKNEQSIFPALPSGALFTWETQEDDGSDDRSTGYEIKNLYKVVHETLNKKAVPVLDLKPLKDALGIGQR